MLVLTRREDETLRIGEQGISVTVLEIRGGRVRLGISAPPDVKVCREEILFRNVDAGTSECVTAELELVCLDH